MNVLFLTIGTLTNINDNGIYSDLLRCFRDYGHNVYMVNPNEKRLNLTTTYTEEDGIYALRVKSGNITKCGKVEKGISTLLIERQFFSAIRKYLSDVRFDLVLYSTPPITLVKVIQYIKKRDNAKTYLLLKDIFPQNAIDLGMMATTGPKSVIYKYFRSKEKKLYELSDRIGCMSQANVVYVLKHNSEVNPAKVEVCPNSIEVQDLRLNDDEKVNMREKYGIPIDRKVFIYGGNLGKPQGISFLTKCLKSQEKSEKAFFLIVGDGTEYSKLETYFNETKPNNMRLMKRLAKEDYNHLVAACDVGMIFLDHRFTIPNFPSRLLAYMQAGLPVLACTDPNTDIGKVITEGGFGWWCESNDTAGFTEALKKIQCEELKPIGQKGYEFLCDNFTVVQTYGKMMDVIK